ncbi:MAG TPA: hypothetical protein VGB82_14900 [Alphaproteobacteria bacterium]
MVDGITPASAVPAEQNRAAAEIVGLAGTLFQNLGAIELLVAAWLLATEVSRAAAQEFLGRTHPLAARVDRLVKLLKADNETRNSDAIAALRKIPRLLRMRNAIAHGAMSMDDGGSWAVTTWTETIPVSVAILAEERKSAHTVMVQLYEGYVVRTGSPPNLTAVAKSAPPPTD